jgi:hypothetical protein
MLYRRLFLFIGVIIIWETYIAAARIGAYFVAYGEDFGLAIFFVVQAIAAARREIISVPHFSNKRNITYFSYS